MAITWEVKIIPINVTRKEASIHATRTDDVTGEEQSFNIITAILDTQQQKINAINQVWQMHLDYDVKQSLIDEYIGTMEIDAKNALEARE